ncbi:tRNA (guanosine(46)-N7)-methyltransferase TrmB [Gemmata sp. JC717]|uniref:tRNA (guanosine(46)-N7)-methyltransferase TrmB n=1 Tax=Gemmata algarum TaxID=2975278 RepID=UPI0021BBA733|nr:tRNA (guanosine(46)-N7)-methyltransferase TrmB [Gemmata algarum]MDY3555358.1 tRNA (guanosine(46)-N7)-methyltransferase TrmB [Gemmata algarum]
MRKPRRLSAEELAPWVWELPQEAGARTAGLKAAAAALPAAPVARERIDWQQFYGNTNPVEIEVGTGKGLFLLNASLARPGTNFLGIEIVRKYQLYAASRYAVRKIPNVKTACADAKLVLRDFVAPGSVQAVHVYFPDPWWKARHKKRRVFTPEFAADAARAIREGGRLYIATDVEEYFGVMTAIVGAMPCFELRPAEEQLAAPRTDAGFATNFERKALEKGGGVWRAVYERTSAPVTVAADPTEAESEGAGSE